MHVNFRWRFVAALAIGVSVTSGVVPTTANAVTPATPTISPAAGTYSSAQTVTISDATSGAAIYYTLDGSTPTITSARYSTPLTISASATVTAVAILSGINNKNTDNSLTGWKAVCINPACSPGGSGTPSATAHTINNASPSLDGDSTKFSETSSKSYSNALWTFRNGSCDECSQNYSDFWVYLGPNSAHAQAFEFDSFNFDRTDNIEFMWGMQWNQQGGRWQIWKQAPGSGHGWVDTSLSTPLSYNAWHHIQVVDHRVIGDKNDCSGEPCMYFDSITIDGIKTVWNLVEPASALPNGWASEAGDQFQIDIASISSSQTLTMNIDESNFQANYPSSAVGTAAYVISASVTPPTSVTVTGPVTVNVGSTGQYRAAVIGSLDQAVTWEVNGASGGSSTYGTISQTGVYTPPLTVPAANTVAIAAVSDDNGVSGVLNATILYPPPKITSAVGSIAGLGQNVLVTVDGSNFMTGATILIGGVPVTTSSPGQNVLQTTVPTPSGEAVSVVVGVQNPMGPGVTLSNTVAIVLSPANATAVAAGRFLDQTSFGPMASTIAHVEQIGLQAALTEQFNEPITLFSEPPSPDAECPLSNFHCTQSEFLSIALFGSDQLRQRVAMALSELWVAPLVADDAMPFYLNTLANDAFTNYRTIMQDATIAPTMGFDLNMVNSAKAPAGQIVNENFAREMMQLFTLGLNLLNPDGTIQADANGNPVAAYSESQVQAFARAYTGWTYANSNGSVPGSFNYVSNWRHSLVPVESQHDTTEKILLNGTTLPAGQSAEQDLTGALDNIFAQPNIAPFVCRQLIQHLVEGNPTPAYVERVAAVFADNGNGVRGDMKAVLTAILMDEEARAGDAQTGDQADSSPAVAEGGHLREPLLWTVNFLRGVGATKVNSTDPYPFLNLMASSLAYVGESPFGQETVFNFFSPQYMIPQTAINSPEFAIENMGSIPLRLNLADGLVHNLAPGLIVNLSASSVIGQQASDPTQLVDYLGTLFMHGQMPTDMRSALIAVVSAIPASNLQARAEVAVYLVVTSSQYKVIH